MNSGKTRQRSKLNSASSSQTEVKLRLHETQLAFGRSFDNRFRLDYQFAAGAKELRMSRRGSSQGTVVKASRAVGTSTSSAGAASRRMALSRSGHSGSGRSSCTCSSSRNTSSNRGAPTAAPFTASVAAVSP